MEADRSFRKRAREHDISDELEFDWAEVKRLRDDLLDDGAFDDDVYGETGDNNDNNKNNPEFAATRDLDSVMRSLQEEITPGATSSSKGANFIDLTSEWAESDSGESPTELGFLLGASDDELGIPPSNINNNNDSSSKLVIDLESGRDRVEYDPSELSELWGFNDQVPACYTYESFEFGGVYETFDDALFVGVNNAFDDPGDLWSCVNNDGSYSYETII